LNGSSCTHDSLYCFVDIEHVTYVKWYYKHYYGVRTTKRVSTETHLGWLGQGD